MLFGDLMTGWAGIFLTVLALAVAIIWIFLPFAVMGIKPKLDQVIAELRSSSEQQRAILAELKRLNGVSASPADR